MQAPPEVMAGMRIKMIAKIAKFSDMLGKIPEEEKKKILDMYRLIKDYESLQNNRHSKCIFDIVNKWEIDKMTKPELKK